MRCLAVIEPSGTGFSAYSPDLPGCVSTGATHEEVEQNIQEAIELHIAMGAERLREPLCPYLRVDLGVDYERAIPYVQSAPNRREVILASDGDAPGPRRPRERCEVGLRKAYQLHRAPHRAEVVHLRAVGRVVVDDDQHRPPVACGRLHLPRAIRAPPSPTATESRSGRATAAPIALASPSPTDWKALGNTKPCWSGTSRYIAG